MQKVLNRRLGGTAHHLMLAVGPEPANRVITQRLTTPNSGG